MISRTSQGLLADLLFEVYESGLPDEELQVASDACGFRYLVELREFVSAPQPDDAIWQDVWQQFIAGIDASEL